MASDRSLSRQALCPLTLTTPSTAPPPPTPGLVRSSLTPPFYGLLKTVFPLVAQMIYHNLGVWGALQAAPWEMLPPSRLRRPPAGPCYVFGPMGLGPRGNFLLQTGPWVVFTLAASRLPPAS